MNADRAGTPRAAYPWNSESLIASKYETYRIPLGVCTRSAMSDIVCEPMCVPRLIESVRCPRAAAYFFVGWVV
jgi:hypothetical protein